jgi:sulfur carrier protein
MEIRVNGEVIATDAPSLYELIVSMKFDPTRVAAELNGKIVPRAEFKDTAVKNGDSLEIVHFVGGG